MCRGAKSVDYVEELTYESTCKSGYVRDCVNGGGAVRIESVGSAHVGDSNGDMCMGNEELSLPQLESQFYEADVEKLADFV